MRKINVCIVDYGVGNTHSVSNALSFLDYKVKISNKSNIIKNSDVLILPGVGAFEAAINNLKQAGLVDLLNELVIDQKKPILGICVGMQMMASYSEENGLFHGLDWIKGGVIKLEEKNGFPVPHVGWNNVNPTIKQPMFSRANNENHFYFDHSYYFKTEKPEQIAAIVDYGQEITAAIQKENICGVQFHPEKSQTNGLKLFRSFINGILEYA